MMILQIGPFAPSPEPPRPPIVQNQDNQNSDTDTSPTEPGPPSENPISTAQGTINEANQNIRWSILL